MGGDQPGFSSVPGRVEDPLWAGLGCPCPVPPDWPSLPCSQGSAPHHPGKCSRGPAGKYQGREEAPVRSVSCPHNVCARQSPLKPRWDSPVPPGCGGAGLRPQPQEQTTTPPSCTDALGLLSRGRAGGAAVGRGRSGPANGDARRAPRGMGISRAELKQVGLT